MINIASFSINTSNLQNCVISKPSGLAVGDLMVAIISSNTYYIAAVPSGWTESKLNQFSYEYCYVYKKIATQDDVNASSFTWTGTYIATGIIYRIPQGDFDNVQVGNYGLNGEALTPTVNNNAIFVVGITTDNDNDPGAFSAYSITGDTSPTFTENYEFTNIYGGDWCGTGIASAIYTPASLVSIGPYCNFDLSTDNRTNFLIVIGETPAVAPTVTTQAVSSIGTTSATGNGNITDTGGVNPHLRGIAYMPASSGDISFIPLPNPSFEDSTLGWTGAGTLARSSEQAKYGTYSMKVTWASGGEAYGEVHPTPATYLGKKITFSAWVWSSVANMACLNIYDNAGAGYEAVQSAYHPGDSTWRLLTVSKTLRSGLTDLILRCRIATGSANSAYFDGVLSPYSDSVSPTLAIDSGNYSTGAFTKALTGLTPNTDYRAVAFAQNSAGTSYGSTVDLTTLFSGASFLFNMI